MRLGQDISIMQISPRHIAARSAGNRNKKTTVIKGKSIPTMTPFMAQVWAAFASAASSAYGGTMEDVNRAVQQGVAGLDTGAKLFHRDESRIRHEQTTPANIQKFREAAGRRASRLGFAPRGEEYQYSRM